MPMSNLYDLGYEPEEINEFRDLELYNLEKTCKLCKYYHTWKGSSFCGECCHHLGANIEIEEME